MSSPQQLPPDFNNIVRLFPLGELVAFPWNVLPLHIFESRYREMFEDAIDGDQLIAMATLVPGHGEDYFTRPPVHSHVCIGRIMGHETTAKGTYEFLLMGVARARIEQEVEPVRSFREAHVTVVDDICDATPDAQEHMLSELTTVLKERFPTAGPLLDVVESGDFSLPALTDFLAFQLPLATGDKLELLEQPDVMRRSRRLLQHCQRPEPGDQQQGYGRHGSAPDFSNN